MPEECEVREPNRGGSGGGSACEVSVGCKGCNGVADVGDSEPWMGIAMSVEEASEEFFEMGCCGEDECIGSRPGVNGVCGEIGMMDSSVVGVRSVFLAELLALDGGGPFSRSLGVKGEPTSLNGSLSIGRSCGFGSDWSTVLGASESGISSENPVNPVIPVAPVDVVRSDMLFFHFLYEYHFPLAGEWGVLLLDPRWIKKVRKAVNETTKTARVSSTIWKKICQTTSMA